MRPDPTKIARVSSFAIMASANVGPSASTTQGRGRATRGRGPLLWRGTDSAATRRRGCSAAAPSAAAAGNV